MSQGQPAPKQVTINLNWASILKWVVPIALGIVGGCFGKQKIDEWRKPDAVLPYLRLPAKVQGIGNQWIPVKADTNGSYVRWVALTPGIEPTPQTMLSDPTGKTQVFTLTEPPTFVSKDYKVLAYTSAGDNIPSEPAYTTITIIGNGPAPTPVPPQPVPPTPVPITQVTVPQFIGLPLGTAYQVAVTVPVSLVCPTNDMQALVNTQSPMAGTQVAKGSVVTVTAGTPEPPPSPAPIPEPGLRVLIVFEKQELSKIPRAQYAALKAGVVRDYLNQHCVKGDDGIPAWRQWDQNDPTDKESPIWQKAMARKRSSLPWIIVSNGKAGYEGPFPADIDATLALLKKFAE